MLFKSEQRFGVSSDFVNKRVRCVYCSLIFVKYIVIVIVCSTSTHIRLLQDLCKLYVVTHALLALTDAAGHRKTSAADCSHECSQRREKGGAG